MSTSEGGRVIVGVDASPASVHALQHAFRVAQQRRAELHVVHAHRPVPVQVAPGSPLRPPAGTHPSYIGRPALDAARERAHELIEATIDRALRSTPSPVSARRVVRTGAAESALVALAGRADDLLVVGTGGGRRWRHPWRRSVSRYCLSHARCPVLVVHPDQPADDLRPRQRPRELWPALESTARRSPQPAR